MATTAERLWEAARTLPEPLLAEVLDFAEFLQARRTRGQEEARGEAPESGDLVRGSGGVRKLRWARAGGGKSGGVRVCYYARTRKGRILLLVIYAKSVRDSISGPVLKALREELDNDHDD